MSASPATPVRMAPPDPSRPPLKTNLFAMIPYPNATLACLFPYLEPGSIVPCVSVYHGGAGRHFGAFEHFNTVDEVVLNFGAHGARLQLGDVRVTAKTHAVGGPLANPADPGSFCINVITQRQAESGEQQEAVRFRCAKCQHELAAHQFRTNSVAKPGIMPQGHEMFFETTIQSAKAAAMLNDDPSRRVCPKCGHQNDPFPLDLWGWHHYAELVGVAREGWRQYGTSTGAPVDGDPR